MKHRHKEVYGNRSGGGSSGQKVRPDGAKNGWGGANVDHMAHGRKKSFGSKKTC